MAVSEETSIAKFAHFLGNYVDYQLQEVEIFVRSLKLGDTEKVAELKFVANEKLNKIYFEFLDFITFLEQEIKGIRLPMLKQLLKKVENYAKSIDDLKEFIAALPAKDVTTQKKFDTKKEIIYEWIENLRVLLPKLQQGLTEADQVLKSVAVNAERAERYLLGEIRQDLQKVKELAMVTPAQFERNKRNAEILLHRMVENLEEHHLRLRQYRKIPVLGRVTAIMQVSVKILQKAEKEVAQASPSGWSEATFSSFKNKLLNELRTIQKNITGLSTKLRDSQKDLVA